MQPKCAETHSNQQVKLGWQKNKHNKLQNIFDLNLQFKLSKKTGHDNHIFSTKHEIHNNATKIPNRRVIIAIAVVLALRIAPQIEQFLQ